MKVKIWAVWRYSSMILKYCKCVKFHGVINYVAPSSLCVNDNTSPVIVLELKKTGID